jgi:hypothetical protein
MSPSSYGVFKFKYRVALAFKKDDQIMTQIIEWSSNYSHHLKIIELADQL